MALFQGVSVAMVISVSVNKSEHLQNSSIWYKHGRTGRAVVHSVT